MKKLNLWKTMKGFITISELCLLVLTIILTGICSTIIRDFRHENAWIEFTDSLTMTLVTEDLYNSTIRLEKENETIELEDITHIINTSKFKLRNRFTYLERNSSDSLLIEYTDINPDKIYTAEAISVNSHKIDIKIETAYMDKFDEEAYKKMTKDSIEELITDLLPDNLFVTANQVSDEIIKVKIRPIK